MSVLERFIEKAFILEATRRGFITLKLNVSGQRGWPDRLVVSAGRVQFVELKRPGGQLDPAQEQVRRLLTQYGHEYHVVRQPADFERVFKR